MKPDTYKLVEMCVETGVVRGLHRAHKHDENPSAEAVADKITQAVMLEICEWFSFDPRDESL